MSSKMQCPVCGQEAEGRRAAKRVRKWAADSRLERFMFDKLMLVVKAQMQDQAQALDKDKLLQQQLASGTFKWNALDPDREPGSEFVPQSGKQAPKAGKLRQQMKETLWGKKKPPAPQFKEVEVDAEKDADWALNSLEKKNEKLAKDRAYQRDYYHKNKQRIERLRKARAGRRASARSPNTGAKANGH